MKTELELLQATEKEFRSYIGHQLTEWLQKNEESWAVFAECEMWEKCTTLQLFALLKLTRRSTPKILKCDVTDHLAVEMSGMYIGIETDGYTHS